MVDKNIKLKEIKRLNSPLTFKNYKAYDNDGNSLKCVENSSKVIFLNEPKVGILDDNEILKNAPNSKKAARIRLSKGDGSFSDKLLVNNSLPWVLGFYYVVLISLMIPIFIKRNIFGISIFIILVIIPLFYLYYIFSLKKYSDVDKEVKDGEFKTKNSSKYSNKKSDNNSSKKSSLNNVKVKTEDSFEDSNNNSFKSYENNVIELKELFDIKEENVRKLVEKRFEPPQITYDKFIVNIDNAHNVFYNQFDEAIDIINLASYSDKMKVELENKIKSLDLIIKQIENLTNELLINNESKEDVEDIKNLVDDLEDLINSVKDY